MRVGWHRHRLGQQFESENAVESYINQKGALMNKFDETVEDTTGRDQAERQLETVRLRGGMFVEAVRVTRMPMMVTDATLPGNPIIFANEAMLKLSGYSSHEMLGQDPHFMNGEGTDPSAIDSYKTAMRQGEDATLEILQYRKDGSTFRAMLFATPLGDDEGSVTNHFLSYLDITRRHDAEENLRCMTEELEARVAARTQELEVANQVLSQLVDEREMLVAEVNHRAKNSLAIAASLISLQAHRQPDDTVKSLSWRRRSDWLRWLASMTCCQSRKRRSLSMYRVTCAIFAKRIVRSRATKAGSASKRTWKAAFSSTQTLPCRSGSSSQSSLPMR